MAAYQCDQNIYYRSFREIIAGGELLVWYSDCYQKHLEIPMCLKENDQHKIDGNLINNIETTFFGLIEKEVQALYSCLVSIKKCPAPCGLVRLQRFTNC